MQKEKEISIDLKSPFLLYLNRKAFRAEDHFQRTNCIYQYARDYQIAVSSTAMTVYYLRFFFTIIQAGGWTGAEKLMSHQRKVRKTMSDKKQGYASYKRS